MESRKNKRSPAAGAVKPAVDYSVLSVSELDREIYGELARQGAAAPGQNGSYTISDPVAARSQTIFPKILDRHGRAGWLLCGVNKMECYIFRQLPAGEKVEYKVMTPSDMDQLALRQLEASGVAAFSGLDQGKPVMQIMQPSKARIQEVLPATLSKIGEDGWQLAAINGPQLYIFSRPVR